MWENVQRRIEGLLSQEGVRLRGEPCSTSGVLWSKDDAYARVFGLERPGRVRGVGFGITPKEEMSQTLQNIPQLHRCQPERPKGF